VTPPGRLAVAVENGWLYQERSDAVSGIERIRRSRSAERVALQRRLEAHERLTGVLLSGGGAAPARLPWR
jgi:hypothetical protein